MEREGIVCMCTGFVRKGNDVIVGFNMDINIGAFEYDVYTDSWLPYNALAEIYSKSEDS